MSNTMPIIIAGVAVAVNLIIIKVKVEKKRYADAGLDGGVLVILGLLFAGTITGLMVATVASSVVSLYLYMSPPKINEQKLKDYFN